MQIFVKTLVLGTLTLEVKPHNTIAEVRAKMRSKIDDMFEGYDVELLMHRMGVLPLEFAGKTLQDDKTLLFYNIQRDNTIHMTGTLGGEGSIRFVPFHFIFCLVLETQFFKLNFDLI